jgi:hypothetical protein
MALAEDDDVVQTLAPNGSDQSFGVRILPRTRRGGDHFADPMLATRRGTRHSLNASKVVNANFPGSSPARAAGAGSIREGLLRLSHCGGGKGQ